MCSSHQNQWVSLSNVLILEENLILSNVLIRELSNFDDWKCSTQQSFILKEVTSYKIGILTAILFETGTMSTPTKSPNPTILSQGGLVSTQYTPFGPPMILNLSTAL